MTYSMQTEKDKLYVEVAGEIDHHSAVIIRQAVDSKIAAEKPKLLILDFSKLDLMDSSGFGFVIGRFKSMTAVGGKVIVWGCKPRIEKMLAMSGAGRFVKIVKEEVR